MKRGRSWKRKRRAPRDLWHVRYFFTDGTVLDTTEYRTRKRG